MGLADLVPPADRWTVAESHEVVTYSRDDDKELRNAHFGVALVAEGPGGVDVPVLRLAHSNLDTASDVAMESVFAMFEDSGSGSLNIGFGARRHSVLVAEGETWRVAGQLVRAGRKQAYWNVDHRYALVLDGAEVGALARQGPEMLWAPRNGPGLVARQRAEGVDPAALGRHGQKKRWARRGPMSDIAWRRGPASALRGLRAAGDAWLDQPEDLHQPHWLEQAHAMRGTWDVWNASGEAVLTLCPPGGAHSTRWAVLPQTGAPTPVEAVILATYVVFAVW